MYLVVIFYGVFESNIFCEMLVWVSLGEEGRNFFLICDKGTGKFCFLLSVSAILFFIWTLCCRFFVGILQKCVRLIVALTVRFGELTQSLF